MMRPRWHKVLADLWSNKTRSILVIASITVGLFALGMIGTAFALLQNDMERSYQSVNPANIQLTTDFFDEEVLEHVRNLPGVGQAEAANKMSARVQYTSSEWDTMDITAIYDTEDQQIAQVRLVDGVYPPGDNEIVLDVYKADDTGVQLGDMLTIELPSGKMRELKLVGIIQDQTIGFGNSGGGFFLAPLQGYVNFDTLQWLEQPRAYNKLLITVSQQPNNIDAIRQVATDVIDDMEDNGYHVSRSVTRRSIDHPNLVYVEAVGVVLFLLGFMVVFLSAFLITNTLSALLKQQTQQIGIMKTVGARRFQINAVYMVLILLFGLIALFIAMPLSGRAGYEMVVFLSGQINYVPGPFRTVLWVQMLQVVIALIVPQIAGFFPILRGTSISIQEALAGNGQDESKDATNVSRAAARLPGIKRPTLIAIRNVFRGRARLILTLITLTLGGSIFISTFNVRNSIENYIASLNQYFIADVAVTFSQPYRTEKVEAALSQVAWIDIMEAWSAAPSEIVLDDGTVDETVNLQAPPAGSELIEPILIEGRWLQPGDRNAITINENFLTRFPDLHPGSTIRLKVNGDEIDWVVVGVFQFAGKAAGYVAYVNQEYLTEITGATNQTSHIRIVAHNGPLTAGEQDDLGVWLEDYLSGAGFDIAEIETGSSLTDAASEGLGILVIVLFIMAVLTALVGSISLAGTMSMNVLERTREIGIMRAVGASDRTIMSMVLLEGLIIGLISWVLGSLLSFPISNFMSNGINQALFGASTDFQFSPVGFFVWLIFAIVLSIVASVMPARNAARLTIREVLAYE